MTGNCRTSSSLFVIVLVLCPIGCLNINARHETSITTQTGDPPIKVVVQSLKEPAQVGRLLPIEVRLRNTSKESVNVVPSLDGSDSGRYPRYLIEVRDPSGDLVRVNPIRRCGNMNHIHMADFVRLAPGEEVDPFRHKRSFGHYMLKHWRPEKAGTYTVRVTYDTSASLENSGAKWSGDIGPEPEPEVWSQLEKMPRDKFESDWVRIEVSD